MKFLDVFNEDNNEVLTLRVRLKVNDQEVGQGDSFRKGEKIAGVDFHILRYLDVAVLPLAEGFYEVKGFFPQK